MTSGRPCPNPNTPHPGRIFRSLALLLPCLMIGGQRLQAAPQTDLFELEEGAFRQAAAHVSGSIVQIQPLGTLERVDGRLNAPGPTSGVIVSRDGLIVTAAYGLAGSPASILVSLPDGSRKSAQVVARDESRQLVLLKVDTDQPLEAAEPADSSSAQVGQWVIAVGRTFSVEDVNLSVGILSATRRVWGRALQTDAKISPNNYGGALVDLEGRVLGILVPLTSDPAEGLGGPDWYDSGIGFAVPLDELLARLPRWREGTTLKPGKIGISLSDSDLYGSPAVIGVCLPESPAQEAGMQAGDEIVAVNGQPVRRQAELKQVLGPLYAGDEVELQVRRGDEQLSMALTLVAEIPPYRRPFLGVLPDRLDGGPGVLVRYVFPDSPAALVGMTAGDRIVELQGAPLANAQAARQQIAGLSPEDSLQLVIERDGQRQPLELPALAMIPSRIPDNLPVPASSPGSEGEQPEQGETTMKLPGEAAEALVYLPDSYDGTTPFGLLVVLTDPGRYDRSQLIRRWETVCQQRHLVLLAPKPTDEKSWSSGDIAFIKQAMAEALRRYSIDATRVVCLGEGPGGSLALFVALTTRDQVRGVITVDGAMPERLSVPPHMPLEPLAVLLVRHAATPAATAERLQETAESFREAMYPLIELPVTAERGELPSELIEQIARWTDTLDRI